MSWTIAFIGAKICVTSNCRGITRKGESSSSLSSSVFSPPPHDGSAEVVVFGPKFKRKYLQMLIIDNQTKLKGISVNKTLYFPRHFFIENVFFQTFAIYC